MGPSMAQKAKVFSSSRNGKGTSLRRRKGGFVAVNPRPLISGFLVRCGEAAKGVFTAAKGVFTTAKGIFVAENP